MKKYTCTIKWTNGQLQQYPEQYRVNDEEELKQRIEEDEFSLVEILKTEEIQKTNKFCNRCDTEVEFETDKDLKKTYPYNCPKCDENMFSFEVHDAEDGIKDEIEEAL